MEKEKTIKIYEEPEIQLKFAQKAAEALVKIVEEGNACIEIQGNKFLKFEGWQMLARFFGYTVGIEKVEKLPNGYSARAVVYDKEGRIIGAAEACCLRDEKNWANKPEFQLQSMAQTRAASKALRNILGWVAVLAKFQAVPAEEAEEIPIVEEEKKITEEDLKQYLEKLPIPEDKKKTAILSLYGFDITTWPEELVEKLPEPGSGKTIYIVAQRKDGTITYLNFRAMTARQKKYLEWLRDEAGFKIPDLRRISEKDAENWINYLFKKAEARGVKIPTNIE